MGLPRPLERTDRLSMSWIAFKAMWRSLNTFTYERTTYRMINLTSYSGKHGLKGRRAACPKYVLCGGFCRRQRGWPWSSRRITQEDSQIQSCCCQEEAKEANYIARNDPALDLSDTTPDPTYIVIAFRGPAPVSVQSAIRRKARALEWAL